MKFIKKNIKKIIGILAVILILTAAFWYGGNAPGSRGFSGFGRQKTESQGTNQQSDIGDNEAKPSDTEEKQFGLTENNSGQQTSEEQTEQPTTEQTETDVTQEPVTEASTEQPETEWIPETTASEASNPEQHTTEVPTTEKTTTEAPATEAPKPDTTETPTTEKPQKPEPPAVTEAPSTEAPTTETPSATENTTEEPTTEQNTYTCTISINCSTILNNWSMLDKSKQSCVPSDGWILRETEVEFKKGQTVFEVLKDITRRKGIQLEYSFTALYGSYYIEGIHNLYEFDCGELSGWEYCVNGKFPSFGCSKYVLKDGDKIEWKYTCDLGADVGNPYFE